MRYVTVHEHITICARSGLYAQWKYDTLSVIFLDYEIDVQQTFVKFVCNAYIDYRMTVRIWCVTWFYYNQDNATAFFSHTIGL